MNTLPAKQEKTMKQIALKSFMQNNPFKTFRIHEYLMSYLFFIPNSLQNCLYLKAVFLFSHAIT